MVTLSLLAGIGLSAAENVVECSTLVGPATILPWTVSPAAFTPMFENASSVYPEYSCVCAVTQSLLAMPGHVLSAALIGVAVAADDYCVADVESSGGDSDGEADVAGFKTVYALLRRICKVMTTVRTPMLLRTVIGVALLVMQLTFTRWRYTFVSGGAAVGDSVYPSCRSVSSDAAPSTIDVPDWSVAAFAAVTVSMQLMGLLAAWLLLQRRYRLCVSSVSLSVAVAMTERSVDSSDANERAFADVDDDDEYR